MPTTVGWKMKVTAYRFLTAIATAMAGLMLCALASFAAAKHVNHYVITNDDMPGTNSATIYVAGGTASAPKLTQKKVVPTGGSGLGGYFAAPQVNIVQDGKQECAYVSDGGSSDIAGIALRTLRGTGDFPGSKGDLGNISLASNGKYLYAAFDTSGTLATFRVEPGCKLKFLGDTAAAGLNGGSVDGMALHRSILVAAYADGSVESFNTSAGVAVSNGDEQFSTGNKNDRGIPAGVDITQDGHYAIFGDAGQYVEVEVSDISSGKLTPTVEYGGPGGGLGSGDSNAVRLSPNESLIYLSGGFTGQVAAAFFDKTKGTLSKGCVSKPLKGHAVHWVGTGVTVTEATSGTGKVLWVAEAGGGDGLPSSIGIVKVSSNGSKCSLTESKNSPASDAKTTFLTSIGAYPPRPF